MRKSVLLYRSRRACMVEARCVEGIGTKRAINLVVTQIAFTVRRARIANFKSTHVSLGDLASLIIFGQHPDHVQAPLDHTRYFTHRCIFDDFMD